MDIIRRHELSRSQHAGMADQGQIGVRGPAKLDATPPAPGDERRDVGALERLGDSSNTSLAFLTT